MSDAPLELLRGLAVLAEPPEEGHARVAEAVGLTRVPSASEYADVFLFQLYPYASVYLGAEGMLGGEARDRVAGFWRALGRSPPPEPDHLAALLGLYVSLGEREAAPPGAEARLVAEARRTLFGEHLAPWVFAYLERVRELAPGPYAEWAEVAHEALGGELLRWGGPTAIVGSVHLLDAPGLPDPRDDGAKPFLDGLLAPVRAGFIVTRADLAGIAAGAGLALRAGERRYALEHLLAQSAPEVLRALAVEAERQGAAHAAREAWLGGSAAYLRGRCDSSAELLRALADAAVAEAIAS